MEDLTNPTIIGAQFPQKQAEKCQAKISIRMSKKKVGFIHGVIPLDAVMYDDKVNVGIMTPKSFSQGEDIVWMSREDAQMLSVQGYRIKLVRNSVTIYGKVYDYGWTPVVYIMGQPHRAPHLSRFLLRVTDKNRVVDHIDGDHLNARRENLRSCTIPENCRNRTRVAKNNKTGITGVQEYIRDNTVKYQARICIDKVQVRLGVYDTIEEAAQVRRKAELEHYGEFAPRAK